MKHEFFDANVYKIGMTKNLKTRMSSYNVAYPTNCTFVYTKNVDNLILLNVEREIHKFMKHKRILNRKEFYLIDINDAINIIETICQSNNLNIIKQNQKENENIRYCYLEQQIESKNTNRNNCRYCNNKFNHISNVYSHELICKDRTDIISIMEKKLNIIPDQKNNTCRFCNFVYTTQSAYSRHKNKGCKEKLQYKIKLEKMLEEQNL